MKKMFYLVAIAIVAAMCVGCTTVYAGPGPHRGHGYHGGPPRHYYYGGYYHHYRGNNGVWLAAGITNVVANGLGIVRTITAPPAYVTQPVYEHTAPVVHQVYTTPVYQYTVPAVQPVYTAPVYQPVIRNVPIYDPWGNVRGYRQVITYEK